MDLRPWYPPRPAETRKGDYGRVVVAGGSDRYAGALAFSALAALRAGADLAFVVAPRRAADVVAGYSPDLITVPCEAPFPEPDVALGIEADALVVGGGVARTALAHKALARLMRESRAPLVADAEALHALREHRIDFAGRPVLLTPHGGEFKVLTGEAWPSDMAQREDAARRAARALGATILVKGARDVIADGERVAVDTAGSPFLTKGGYGDLMAGVAGAMLARKVSAFDAGRVAAALVGRAGALAAEALGESTLASDALARFPDALRESLRSV